MNTTNFDPLGLVSVALLSCNRCSELEVTLARLTERGDIWHEIIVADNASTDGTVRMIKEQFPRVKLLETGGNFGVRGINQAYRMASGKWVLSLDDDSYPQLESWGELIEGFAGDIKHDLIALSIRANNDLSRENQTVESRGHESAHDFANSRIGGGNQSKIRQTFGFSQAGCIFRRGALDRIGCFDEELFLWVVELHWVARALIRGSSLARCDSACVVHRSVAANRSSERHAFHYCRNTFLFMLRYVARPQVKALMSRYLRDVVLFTLIHRTGIYLRAIADTIRLHRENSIELNRLSRSTLRAIRPDWRAPFSYLG